jgi:hypothetical protein
VGHEIYTEKWEFSLLVCVYMRGRRSRVLKILSSAEIMVSTNERKREERIKEKRWKRAKIRKKEEYRQKLRES